MTLENPTTRKPSKGQTASADQTVEVETWPDEARIASLISNGFTYQEAMHMSPRDYRRYSALFAAWSIPANERVGGAKAATQADIDAEFGDC